MNNVQISITRTADPRVLHLQMVTPSPMRLGEDDIDAHCLTAGLRRATSYVVPMGPRTILHARLTGATGEADDARFIGRLLDALHHDVHTKLAQSSARPCRDDVTPVRGTDRRSGARRLPHAA